MQKVLLLCFTAVFLTGFSAFSHMLAKPVVSGGKGYGNMKVQRFMAVSAVSAFEISRMQGSAFPFFWKADISWL